MRRVTISDKELTTIHSGILDLLEPGDLVMADCGFDIEDIEEDLILFGNIPPFLRGKTQLMEKELVTTRITTTITTFFLALYYLYPT